MNLRPTYEEIVELMNAIDPDIMAAVDEVDRTLIRDALELSPLERIARAEQAAAALSRFKDELN